MTRRIALLTSLLVLALAVPAAAQQSPFGPLPQAATPTPTATAAPTTDDGTTGRTTLFIIGGALLIGFAVMGWYITRDARRSIPEAELASGSRLREQGPHKHQKQAKAKARARTRRQKQARKAHRKR
jgi:hypothetical protein